MLFLIDLAKIGFLFSALFGMGFLGTRGLLFGVGHTEKSAPWMLLSFSGVKGAVVGWVFGADVLAAGYARYASILTLFTLFMLAVLLSGILVAGRKHVTARLAVHCCGLALTACALTALLVSRI